MHRFKLSANSKIAAALLLSLALILTTVIGGTFAYLIAKTPSLFNTFISGLDPSGDLIIQKNLEHPFGDGYKVPDTITFPFRINLGENYAGKTVTTSHGDLTADNSGAITVTIKPGSSFSVQEILEDTEVSISEILSEGSGFSVKEGLHTQNVIIERGRNEVVFTNIYTPSPVEPVSLTVTGTKVLEGRDWQEGDTFTFLLEYKLSGPESVWQELGTASVSYELIDGTPKADFDKFSFTELVKSVNYGTAGEYSFRVSEVAGSIGGVTYEKVVSYFDIFVGDADMNGSLEIQSVEGYQNAKAGFDADSKNFFVNLTVNNHYAPAGTAGVQIAIHKTVRSLSGEEQSKAGYIFTLYDEEGKTVKTSPVTSAAGETFIELSFDAKDAGKSFFYALKEDNDGKAGITYDDTEYNLCVSVVDNLDGTISAYIYDADDFSTKTEEVPKEEEEETEPSDPEPSTPTNCETEGCTLGYGHEGDCNNPVTPTDCETEGCTLGYGHEGNCNNPVTPTDCETDGCTLGYGHEGDCNNPVTPTACETEGCTLGYGHEGDCNNPVTPTDCETEGCSLGYGHEGDCNNPVTPTDCETKGCTLGYGHEGSCNNAEPENTPDPLNIDPNLLEDVETIKLPEGQFSSSSASFTVNLNIPPFVIPDHNIPSNSPKTKEITVIPESASDVYEVSFENTYDPKDAKTSISGKKELTGRRLQSGEFDFDLYSTDADFAIAKGEEPIESVSNDSDGKFSFEVLSFDKVGTYYFAVKEDTSEGLGGVIYDDTVFHIKVTVTDENGVLKARTAITDDLGAESQILFRNSYVPRSTSVTFSGEKKLTGAKLKPGMFTFTLYQTDKNFKILGAAMDAAVNNASGEFTFDAVDYSEAAEFYYVISEDATNPLENITYDNSRFGITVSVRDNGQGQLVSYVSIQKIGGSEVEEIVFTNTYKEPEKPTEPSETTKPTEPTKPTKPTKPSATPPTGDQSNIQLYTASMFISLAAITILLLHVKNKKRLKT